MVIHSIANRLAYQFLFVFSLNFTLFVFLRLFFAFFSPIPKSKSNEPLRMDMVPAESCELQQ